MEVLKPSVAGTMESSDIMITLEPGSGSIEIELQSVVDKQFGRQIRSVIAGTLAELRVESAKVSAVDKGALDCTIQARVKTAVYRSAGKDCSEWKVTK
jgi:citrate lyase subunit gamma (acyl carrier protein)